MTCALVQGIKMYEAGEQEPQPFRWHCCVAKEA